ncbi:MAG TPA: hypothetical protein VF050_12605 [Moraxellaceae bacterium]
MKILFLLPVFCLLAACAKPPGQAEASTFDPGPDCRDECARGYRWVLDNDIESRVKCRGEGEFARGCIKALQFKYPFREE